MAKERTRNDTRSRIAHLAARLMAEDGIEDYALAKRKAARQAGVPDSRQLPGNEEIDAALRTYQQLYQENEHRSRLRELRREALHAMRELARFNPYLTGSVLSGNAGKYADIDLQLYTDNVKAVELYLIDRGIPYRAAQSRLYSGELLRIVPTFTVNIGGADIRLLVLASRDLRAPLRTSPEGKPLERAKLQAVAELLVRT
ncbi:MAG: hypothetical protein HY526_05480 [Betaproteobacteria bacterium]|nr:hypothetical protein [Betaproteobacteria bacterium]